jgi:hypothetical protein
MPGIRYNRRQTARMTHLRTSVSVLDQIKFQGSDTNIYLVTTDGRRLMTTTGLYLTPRIPEQP